jgi:hypothetical protein
MKMPDEPSHREGRAEMAVMCRGSPGLAAHSHTDSIMSKLSRSLTRAADAGLSMGVLVLVVLIAK